MLSQINGIGTPFIENYTRSDFKAGQQNWMIDQSADGRLYFANNDGLLEFDGINWHLYPLPNGTIVRSINAVPDGKIYIGGYNEFGYFEPDQFGALKYHSLNSKLNKDDQNFDEIWRIHNTPDGLIFQSYRQIFILRNNEITTIKAPGVFHFSFFVNGQLYVNDLEKGMQRYSMGNFYPLLGTDKLKGLEIWAVLPLENKLLFATAEKGIYIYDGNQLQPWINQAADYLKLKQVYSATDLDKDHFAFGTILDGLLICTKNGTPVQKINRLKGLQNNTILNLFKDSSGNLWLGTDNGIDYLEINSPLSYLSYAQGLSAGYTAKLHNDILYLGTNQGVLYKKWADFSSTASDTPFKLIENTSGQVWTLQVINDELFCGTHNGTFIIRGNQANKISEIPGGWSYRQHPFKQNMIIGGTYSGLVLFENQNNQWKQRAKIKGFDESSRIFEFDTDGSLWMSHGFKGIYHIFLNQQMDSVIHFDFYNQDLSVTKLNDDLYFAGSDGLYHFNKNNNAIAASTFLTDIISWIDLAKLTEDDAGNIWYFDNRGIGVLRKLEDGAYTNINLPFKQLHGKLVGGFEFAYPINEKSVLIGVSEGFAYYNPVVTKNYQAGFNVYIDKVMLPSTDSVICYGRYHETNSKVVELNFADNSLYFTFAANDFENPGGTQYATYLEGYENDWTNWEPKNIREFTNLREGDYTFMVKAKNIYGTETQPVAYAFSVLPPWQRSTTAFALYALFALLLAAAGVMLIKAKIERSKLKEAKLQQEKFKEREDKLQRETLEAEKEIIRLRNEKLREQMTMKDKELANATMEMIQKNKVLNKIKSDLKKIPTNNHNEDLKNHVQTLTRKINKELDSEKQWEVFETHFENVHEAFLKRLKNEFPELSPRELKLCAYLRMNISSKEIAALMNISTRGVEISRYRLRKKLNLSRNDNLADFILSF